MLSPTSLPRLQAAIADANLDGWLLFDFHGANPIAGGMLGLDGMVTRRVFAFVPREGLPVAITHAIEQGPWHQWPREWRREVYSSWRVLEETLARLVKGKRVAMEYSPGDAVPYLDRIPAGVLEMVRAAGADVVSSADLVTRFYAAWSPADVETHVRAAERIATIAQDAIRRAGAAAKSGQAMAEHELQAWILEQFAAHGLETDHGPIVASGANAANPHYAPSAERPQPIRRGEMLLIDLWARERGGVFADQTWMGAIGEPSKQSLDVWTAVRDARDAAIKLLQERIAAGQEVRGGELDDAARAVIVGRGFGPQFTHRTGHSIDPRDLHGAGPHLDNVETREERRLVPGVGFSIEPGVYLTGEVGARSEVNAFLTDRGVTITPSRYQTELLVV